MIRPGLGHRRPALQRLLLLICLWGVVSSALACQSTQPPASNPQPVASADDWKDWQVLDTRLQKPVDLDTWLNSLSQFDILYLGEEHHNRYHIEAALKVLRSLVQHGRQPALALEMFGWDGQAALDRYVMGDSLPRTEFLTESKWSQNWGGPLEDYEPLLEFAREHHLNVRAMNPPKSLIRNVVRRGLGNAQADPEWNQWGMAGETIVDDPQYRAKIFDQLRHCHGGGAPEDYQTMYEASMVRDEAMAKTLAANWHAIRADPAAQGPVVSYTGGGHVQYRLPVPKRVARRLEDTVKQTTIYMTSFDPSRTAEVRQLMEAGVADYLWLTPLGKQGLPRRCG